MNKKRKAIQSLSAMLAMLALVCVSLVSFTACSDDDEPVAEVTYSWKFEEVNPSTPDFMDDKNKIESAFKTALGATGSATSVTKQGTAEQCDQEVLEACQQAFNSLKGEAWQGRYVFVVTNTTTGTTICTATFDADDENIEFLSKTKSYTASDLKLGDYYYSDGTWSDGGLRKTDYLGRMIECADTKPLPESGKTVIGIVFYGGHHPKDNFDYSRSGIGQKECHGYVVALTDVNNGMDDLICWENGPDEVYNKVVGTSTYYGDWQGYSNSLKFHEFVNKDENKEAGWEMIHFPAALACETYGKRTLDNSGNPTDAYDWQKPLAAPKNTSGWFLPSKGHLDYLHVNRSFLTSRMTDVKNSIPADCKYRDKIRWFSPWNYWSSTEDSDYPIYAWSMHFSNSYISSNLKGYTFGVRAVLAF